jgi:hypothetical protein
MRIRVMRPLILVAGLIVFAPGAALRAQQPPPAAGAAAGATPVLDTALAVRYFAEARAVARRDGGRLWGVPLGGTLIFGDVATRQVVAERGDSAGVLRRAGSVWVGTMPADRNVANTAQEWGGVRWTTIVWPPPAGDGAEARARRAELFAHELWHAVQERIGLPARDPANAHLQERLARVLLRLEGRALAAAIAASGASAREAMADALRFRALRHRRFPGADTLEAALERHEGMASYTGLRLSGRDVAGRARRARELLAVLDTAAHPARSFAYATGPAYGVLLDRAGGAWLRDVVAGSGPAALLARRIGSDGAADSAAAMARAGRYGGSAIEEQEAARVAARDARTAELRRRLVEGPVLRLPLGEMRMQIDPTTAEPVGDAGTAYASLRLSDRWGLLEVTGGSALLAADFSAATVSLAGGGWTLALADGYLLTAGARPGDLTVRKR